MRKINSRPDAATGTTTAKEMTKTEVKENKMFAIKAKIEEYVRPIGEISDDFVNRVNKITQDEAGFTTPIVSADYVIENNVHLLCDVIIYSSMSADKKLFILNRLLCLLHYVNGAGCIEGYSVCDKLLEDMIRCDADCRIAHHNEKKNNMNNTK